MLVFILYLHNGCICYFVLYFINLNFLFVVWKLGWGVEFKCFCCTVYSTFWVCVKYHNVIVRLFWICTNVVLLWACIIHLFFACNIDWTTSITTNFANSITNHGKMIILSFWFSYTPNPFPFLSHSSIMAPHHFPPSLTLFSLPFYFIGYMWDLVRFLLLSNGIWFL